MDQQHGRLRTGLRRQAGDRVVRIRDAGLGLIPEALVGIVLAVALPIAELPVRRLRVSRRG